MKIKCCVPIKVPLQLQPYETTPKRLKAMPQRHVLGKFAVLSKIIIMRRGNYSTYKMGHKLYFILF